jgi:hypothetical protein
VRSTPIPLLAMRRTVKLIVRTIANSDDRAANSCVRSVLPSDAEENFHQVARTQLGIFVDGASTAFNKSLIITHPYG